MQDIHPIRPPVEVGLDPAIFTMTALILAGILAAAVLFFLIKKFIRRRKDTRLPTGLPRTLHPYDSAMKTLENLEEQGAGDPRAVYFALTLVLRKYIGGSFGSHASEMTTQEFNRYVGSLEIDKSMKAGISEFNAFSDPVKYAGMTPEPDRVRKDQARVRDLIVQIESDLEKKRQADADNTDKEAG